MDICNGVSKVIYRIGGRVLKGIGHLHFSVSSYGILQWILLRCTLPSSEYRIQIPDSLSKLSVLIQKSFNNNHYHEILLRKVFIHHKGKR